MKLIVKYVKFITGEFESMQAFAMFVMFGMLGIACLIASLRNPWQLLYAGMCFTMALIGYKLRNE